jgi:hypothetical protein
MSEHQDFNWTTLQEKLAEPFAPEVIYWRSGAISKDRKRAQALPYAEPRVYEDRLNEVCLGDWMVTFKPWGDARIICELTIHGITRSSTGEENDGFAPGTAAEAQAFKRACSKFGLGRYLYDIPIEWVDYDAERGRLLQSPRLPEKFLPEAKVMTMARPISPDPRLLSAERADAMSRELVKLGYEKREQLKLARAVLGHQVTNLAFLTEAEALEVWTYARRTSQDAA